MANKNELFFRIFKNLEPDFAEKTSDTNLLRESKIETAKQFSILTDAFVNPLCFVRICGNNPYTFTKVEHETGVTYRRFDFKWKSWITLYSLFAQCFYLGGFAGLVERLYHGHYLASVIPGSETNTKRDHSTGEGLMKAFLISFFLACGAGSTTSFRSSPQFAKFLNNWKEFSFKFNKVFPGKHAVFKPVLTQAVVARNFSILFSTLYFLWAPYVYKNCLFGLKECTYMEIEQAYMMLGFGCTSMINMTFEQHKLMVMMRVVIEAFSQIKKTTLECKHNFVRNEAKLIDLYQLVYLTRKQCKILADVVGPPQIFVLFFLFSLTIIVWLLVMQISTLDFPKSLLFILSSIGIIQYTRFGFFTKLVETVQHQEKMIAEIISQMPSHTLRMQIEMQIFVNLILNKPSQFVFSNAITFRRSLLLSLFSNSTSYLIAILQLIDVKNTDVTQVLAPTAETFLNYTQQ